MFRFIFQRIRKLGDYLHELRVGQTNKVDDSIFLIIRSSHAVVGDMHKAFRVGDQVVDSSIGIGLRLHMTL